MLQFPMKFLIKLNRKPFLKLLKIIEKSKDQSSGWLQSENNATYTKTFSSYDELKKELENFQDPEVFKYLETLPYEDVKEYIKPITPRQILKLYGSLLQKM
jgi:hypothetical protein